MPTQGDVVCVQSCVRCILPIAYARTSLSTSIACVAMLLVPESRPNCLGGQRAEVGGSGVSGVGRFGKASTRQGLLSRALRAAQSAQGALER